MRVHSSQLEIETRKCASDFPDNEVVLGFDCEWSASLTSRRKVAVVQVSCVDGYTAIFRLKSRAGRDCSGDDA